MLGVTSSPSMVFFHLKILVLTFLTRVDNYW